MCGDETIGTLTLAHSRGPTGRDNERIVLAVRSATTAPPRGRRGYWGGLHPWQQHDDDDSRPSAAIFDYAHARRSNRGAELFLPRRGAFSASLSLALQVSLGDEGGGRRRAQRSELNGKLHRSNESAMRSRRLQYFSHPNISRISLLNLFFYFVWIKKYEFQDLIPRHALNLMIIENEITVLILGLKSFIYHISENWIIFYLSILNSLQILYYRVWIMFKSVYTFHR